MSTQLISHSELIPTNFPWKMDVVQLKNSLLLGSNPLADHGGYICFLLLLIIPLSLWLVIFFKFQPKKYDFDLYK